MVQKPLQDIYTAVLFVTFILIMVMAGMQAVAILGQFETVSFDVSQAGINTDNPGTPGASAPEYEGNGYNDCEVIHHQASRGSEYSGARALRADAPTAETELDTMGTLYYAVYTCSGVAVIADGYI